MSRPQGCRSPKDYRWRTAGARYILFGQVAMPHECVTCRRQAPRYAHQEGRSVVSICSQVTDKGPMAISPFSSCKRG